MKGKFLFLFLITGLMGSFVSANAQTSTDTLRMVHLNRVLVIGNKKTKKWIIDRELSLRPGDSIPYYQLKNILEKDRIKIYNLRLFHTANLRILDYPVNQFDILIELEERWYFWPIPVFELSDRNFNEWWQNYDHKINRVNYGMKLLIFNFRGRNETIWLNAGMGFTRKFDLIYRIPYIDKKQKQGLIFDANFSEPKNLAYRTLDHKLVFIKDDQTLRKRYGVGITYTYRKNFYETHSVRLEYDKSTISDTVILKIANGLGNDRPSPYFLNNKKTQWYTALSYSFVSEHRDVIAYPLSGYNFSVSLTNIGLGLNKEVNQTNFTAKYSIHKKLNKGFFVSNHSSAYWATPDKQPYYLYYGLGYKKQYLRGYEIYVIEGPWFVMNKSTIKKKIFQQTYRLAGLPWERFQHVPLSIYLKAFADLGYVRNYSHYQQYNLNTTLSNKLIGGAGLGIDLVTAYDSVVRIEYTWNLQGLNGFYFHIRKEF